MPIGVRFFYLTENALFSLPLLNLSAVFHSVCILSELMGKVWSALHIAKRWMPFLYFQMMVKNSCSLPTETMAAVTTQIYLWQNGRINGMNGSYFLFFLQAFSFLLCIQTFVGFQISVAKFISKP